MKSWKKFFAFVGIFILSSLVFNIISGLIITYFYEPNLEQPTFAGTSTEYRGVSTLITTLSAITAILFAYKPFKKQSRN
jgi:quinol-cytochrome oxidoreductase complex cytochrome b subunit